MAEHVVQKYRDEYGRLTRNSTYKAGARSHLDGTGLYDKPLIILAGLQVWENEECQKNGWTPTQYRQKRTGGLSPAERVESYTFNYRKPNGELNFDRAGPPYFHQAHHIIPCEIFYDDKWFFQDEDLIKAYLDVVLMSGYDINNPENIIYLPQASGDPRTCRIHWLPDHSRDHNLYNERVEMECDEVYDMVEEALAEKDHELQQNILKQIYDKLVEIQNDNYRRLTSCGPVYMPG